MIDYGEASLYTVSKWLLVVTWSSFEAKYVVRRSAAAAHKTDTWQRWKKRSTGRSPVEVIDSEVTGGWESFVESKV